MRLRQTPRFVRAYLALPESVQARIDKALEFLAASPHHPSLRLKKLHGAVDVWEARVDRHHRITLEIRKGYYLLRTVGGHDEVLDRP